MKVLDKKYWIAIACRVCLILTSFLATIFINRGLGVEGKGEYAYVINLVGLLFLFFSVGIGQCYSTFKRSNGDKVLGSFVSLSVFHGAIVMAVGLLIVYTVNIENGFAIAMLTSLSVTKSIISMLAVTENSIKRNLSQTGVDIIYLGVLMILYFTHSISVNLVLVAYGCNELLSIIVFSYLFKFRPDLRFIKANYLKQIYKVGLLTMVVMMLISINYSIDTIMLKNLSTTYEVGLYSVAVNFSNMFLLIPDSFKEVLFGDSTRKDFSKKTAINSIEVSFVASIVIFLGFIVLGRFVISVFYGVEFVDAYKLTLMLFCGSFPMIFFKILQPVYISHGGQRKAAVFLSLSAIVNIVLNIILISRLGAMGAAVASAVSYTVCGLLFLIDYLTKFSNNSGIGDKLAG